MDLLIFISQFTRSIQYHKGPVTTFYGISIVIKIRLSYKLVIPVDFRDVLMAIFPVRTPDILVSLELVSFLIQPHSLRFFRASPSAGALVLFPHNTPHFLWLFFISFSSKLPVFMGCVCDFHSQLFCKKVERPRTANFRSQKSSFFFLWLKKVNHWSTKYSA